MMDKHPLTPRSFVDSTGKTVNLARVAIALRRLQVCLLLFLASLGAFTVFKVNGYPQFSGPAAGLAIVFGFALVVLQFRLSMACGGRFGEALCFLLVTPLFPPILIVWFGGYYYEARSALRRAGCGAACWVYATKTCCGFTRACARRADTT